MSSTSGASWRRSTSGGASRSASWVSRRLAPVEELPETIQERVQRGELPAHAAMKHLVPLARANLDACERLVAAIGGKGATRDEWSDSNRFDAGTKTGAAYLGSERLGGRGGPRPKPSRSP